MTTFTDIMKRGEKSTQHEWGHWDLNPDLRVSSGS